ncbi:MAG: hypothetical protein IJD10_04935 [Clostridia bacterium]|nr:hypothetical protein [Clostridia bacterium]
MKRFSLFLFSLLLIGGILASCEANKDTDPRPLPDLPADAAALDALISSIDGATIENEDKMDRAYLGYWSLSEEERAKVAGYETLQSLRTELLKAYVVKEYADTRIPHHRFLIGSYHCRVSADEQAIQELLDANIDFVWRGGQFTTEAEDGRIADVWAALNENGIGMFNYAFDHAVYEGPDSNNISIIDMIDSPNLWAIEVHDEPPAHVFEGIGQLGLEMLEHLPGVALINNLYPNGATSDQLGLPGYDMYVEDYLNYVSTDILCYDHYPYTSAEKTLNHLNLWLKNLLTVRDIGLEEGKDLYVIAQVSNTQHGGLISEDELRFQAYSAMAFGYKSVSWFLWKSDDWTSVYYQGERTEQYEKLVAVNAELKALEPIFMRYTTSGAGYLFNKPVKGEVSNEMYDMLTKLRQTGMKDVDKSVVTNFTVEGNEIVQVGQFKKNVGEGTALMLLNITDYTYENKTTAKVAFTTVDPATLVTAYVKGIPTVLDPDENGVYSLDLDGAEAVFLTFD